MDDKDLKKLHKSIEEKIGKENFAKISDDMATIVTGNKLNLQSIQEKQTSIEELKKENESLVKTNGRLFQQIAMGEDEEKVENEKVETENKPIDFKSLFSKTGELK